MQRCAAAPISTGPHKILQFAMASSRTVLSKGAPSWNQSFNFTRYWLNFAEIDPKSSNSSQTQDSRLNSMNLIDAKQRFGLIWGIYWPLCHPASRFRLLNEAFCQLLEDYSLVNQLSEVVEGCHQIGRFEQQQLGLNQELIIIILYII